MSTNNVQFNHKNKCRNKRLGIIIGPVPLVYVLRRFCLNYDNPLLFPSNICSAAVSLSTDILSFFFEDFGEHKVNSHFYFRKCT